MKSLVVSSAWNGTPAALKASAAPSSRSTTVITRSTIGALRADCLDGLHGRAAGGRHVLQDHHALALKALARRQPLDQLLGAVLLGLLAHEEGGERPALGLAHAPRTAVASGTAPISSPPISSDLRAFERLEDQQRR